MRYNKCFLFFLLGFFSGFSQGSEEIYFSCSTKKGVVKLFVDNRALNYTIKNEKSFFRFKSKGDKFKGFSHNIYSRYQTEYVRVIFSNNNYTYSIFSDYEDGHSESGVIVTNKGKKYRYACESVFVNKLNMLAPLLSCNKDDALGCA